MTAILNTIKRDYGNTGLSGKREVHFLNPVHSEIAEIVFKTRERAPDEDGG